MFIQVCSFCNQSFDLIANSFTCPKCHKLNALPGGVDYFTYFGLESILPIDLVALEGKYTELAAVMHSDNYIMKTPEEQLNSLMHISFLNNAYLTLKNEIKSIAYLYQVLAKENLVEENTTIKDPKFNQYIFMLNEEQEDAETPEDKTAFKHKIVTIYNDLKAQILAAFTNQNYSLITEESLYVKLLYINRIKEKL